MPDRADNLLAQEDPRFYAVDKIGTGLGMLASTERLSNSLVSFGLPSGPALNLNIAYKAHRDRAMIPVDGLFDLHPPPQGSWPENHSPLFDYFELAVTEVLFSYSAIEGAMNELIEPSAVYRRPLKKGRPPEILHGVDIERKVSLDEKLKKALPVLLDKVSFAGGPLWVEYLQLQDLRDRLIHLKSLDRRASGPEDETVWGRLLRIGETSYPETARCVIAHFYPAERRWFKLVGKTGL